MIQQITPTGRQPFRKRNNEESYRVSAQSDCYLENLDVNVLRRRRDAYLSISGLFLKSRLTFQIRSWVPLLSPHCYNSFRDAISETRGYVYQKYGSTLCGYMPSA